VKSQGWNAVHSRHQRQRQARRRLCAAEPAVDPTKTSASASASIRSRLTRRMADLGHRDRVSGVGGAGRSRPEPVRNALAEIYEVPLPGYCRAAATSTASSCGRRSRAGISAPSTAANQGPANGPNATGKHCPRAGRSIAPGRSRGVTETAAARRPTMPGSTSTTRLASARTSPLPTRQPE